jgi:4-carboxymuconolactone decarboxylase
MKLLVGLLVVSFTAAASGAAAAQAIPDSPGARQPAAPKSPRVQPLAESQWTDVHRELVQKFAKYGPPDNAFKTFLNVPEMADGVMPYTIYLSEESSLTPRQRELLILRAAWVAGNQVLWARHAPRARGAGMTTAEIHRIAEGGDAKGWDAFEATLLRMTDQLYRNMSVTDGTWQALSGTFDMFHLMDAVETANHFVVLSMLYNTFGVQPEAGLKDRLPTDVRYRIVVPAREAPLKVARVLPPEGRGLAVGRTFGLYPTLTQRWSPRQTFINRRSPLSPRHREMLILRMGWNCRSEYEWAQHVGVVGRAREHGLEPQMIAQGPDAAGWEPIERTILRASDELFRDSVVSDATWKGLVDQFGVSWAMSAAFTTSGYRAISMSLNTYGVQLETGDERFPAAGGPLRRGAGVTCGSHQWLFHESSAGRWSQL